MQARNEKIRLGQRLEGNARRMESRALEGRRKCGGDRRRQRDISCTEREMSGSGDDSEATQPLDSASAMPQHQMHANHAQY